MLRMITKQWKDSVGVVPISCVGLVARADEPVVTEFPGTTANESRDRGAGLA